MGWADTLDNTTRRRDLLHFLPRSRKMHPQGNALEHEP